MRRKPRSLASVVAGVAVMLYSLPGVISRTVVVMVVREERAPVMVTGSLPRTLMLTVLGSGGSPTAQMSCSGVILKSSGMVSFRTRRVSGWVASLVVMMTSLAISPLKLPTSKAVSMTPVSPGWNSIFPSAVCAFTQLQKVRMSVILTGLSPVTLKANWVPISVSAVLTV